VKLVSGGLSAGLLEKNSKTDKGLDVLANLNAKAAGFGPHPESNPEK
jgi:hypothetical protein